MVVEMVGVWGSLSLFLLVPSAVLVAFSARPVLSTHFVRLHFVSRRLFATLVGSHHRRPDARTAALARIWQRITLF